MKLVDGDGGGVEDFASLNIFGMLRRFVVSGVLCGLDFGLEDGVRFWKMVGILTVLET